VFIRPWPAGLPSKRRDKTIYYQYRADRARRTLRGIDEQVAKAARAVVGLAPVKWNRFIQLDGDTEPSERVEAGLEQAELSTLGVSKNVPGLLAGLADIGRARPELQEALKLGVLIAVGGVDVDVQPGLPLLRLIPAPEDDCRLGAAEPLARPDLEGAVLFAIEDYEVQDLTPELRQHPRVAATEHQLTCH
jgi:hypothetical protein